MFSTFQSLLWPISHGTGSCQAGLFSAINTAFIAITIASLSADPGDQTNALLVLLVTRADNATIGSDVLNPTFHPSTSATRQNCVFFASLCSSLLAAAGAVLAKQWLGTYERTGQIGSHEYQSLQRTNKYFGAESWKLRPVVEALPNLLLLSLALFFAALIDWLWDLSQPVALVVLGFTGVGTALYAISFVAGAMFQRCPYQTPASTSARIVVSQVARRTSETRAWQWLTRHTPSFRYTQQPANRSIVINMLVKTSLFLRLPGFGDSSTPEEEENDSVRSRVEKETLHAQSALWMLKTATEDKHFCITADNIPQIHSRAAVHIIAKSPDFSKLVTKFRTTILTGNAKNDGHSQALTIARAVAHVFAADPLLCSNSTRSALQGLPVNKVSSHEVSALHSALRLCCQRVSVRSDAAIGARRTADDQDGPTTVVSIQHSTAVPLYTLFALLGSSQEIQRYNAKPDDDRLISLTALTIVNSILTEQGRPPGSDWRKHVETVWSARSGYVSVLRLCACDGYPDTFLILQHRCRTFRGVGPELAR